MYIILKLFDVQKSRFFGTRFFISVKERGMKTMLKKISPAIRAQCIKSTFDFSETANKHKWH